MKRLTAFYLSVLLAVFSLNSCRWRGQGNNRQNQSRTFKLQAFRLRPKRRIRKHNLRAQADRRALFAETHRLRSEPMTA